MNFSDMLKLLRKSKQMTQNELADAVGLKRSAISMYESGLREPDFETAELFADFFNVDMDKLMGRKIEQAPSLSLQELQLLADFRSLSRDGQNDAMRYVRMLKRDEDDNTKKEEKHFG